jgi:two-component system KDP operon response regulator KdpE
LINRIQTVVDKRIRGTQLGQGYSPKRYVPPTGVPLRAPANGLRVLISEDEEEVARALRLTLEGHGYECALAYDAAETIKKIKTFQPHLLTTDITKPGIDGFEMISIIKKEIDPKLPIIIFSAAISEVSRKALGYALGVDDIVDKPSSPPELLQRIQAVVERRIRGVSV